MQFTPELIEEIRARSNIVDVIGEYIHLDKKGSNYMGLCPFHNEKSPSFSVSENKQMFHCFGCGAGGDVFTFIQKYNSLTFPETVKYLADRAGVTMPDTVDDKKAKAERSKRQILYDINKEAAKFYYFNLRSDKGQNGIDYFNKRQLTNETMQKFGLGFASVNSKALTSHLHQKGFKDSDIIDAGLGSFDEKRGMHDTFWNRVMFPIQDINNKVIGFGGRVMGDAKPKYLNSTDTLIFNKRRNLYGLNYAKNNKFGNIILCEGYMDVIAMHQAGFNQAVASLGTAFTAEQANLLKRYTDEVILSYDSDGAGTKAALRAIDILNEVGIRGKVLNLEPYKDPDEFIKALGKEKFEERVRNAENPFFFQIRIMQRDEYDLTDPESKTRFYKAVARKLCEFNQELERENYTQAIAAKLGIPVDGLKSLIVEEASKGVYYNKKAAPKSGIQQKKDPKDNILKPQRLLLTWIADEPAIYNLIKKYIKADDFVDELYRKVATAMFEGLEAGRFVPAQVMSLFPEIEDQERVAEIFNTNLIRIETKDEKEKALKDIIYDIRLSSYNNKMKELQFGDKDALKVIVEAKKELENLAHAGISLDG